MAKDNKPQLSKEALEFFRQAGSRGGKAAHAKRTEAEQRRIARKAGKASGKARKAKGGKYGRRQTKTSSRYRVSLSNARLCDLVDQVSPQRKSRPRIQRFGQ